MGKSIISLSIADDEMERVAFALSSPIRRKIIKLVNKNSYTIVALAEQLNIPVSTTAFHVKVLREVGLILVVSKLGSKGNAKVVSRLADEVILDLRGVAEDAKTQSYSFHLPVGSFSDISAHPTCGMANENDILAVDDLPSAFFIPERFQAQILWLAKGWIEYRIPNFYCKDKELINVSISLELCSEAPNYQNDWPSDITFWINGVELCTYLSEGDFGKRRGRLNPSWWSDYSTQYGLLTNVTVDRNCVYLNEDSVSGVKIQNLKLQEGEYFVLRFGNKPDAKNQGGMNIFGETFGDYAQDIIVRMEYRDKA